MRTGRSVTWMARQARNTCAGCLWLWRALQESDGGQRRCYQGGSAHFHQTRCLKDAACGAFEHAVSSTDHPRIRERKRK